MARQRTPVTWLRTFEAAARHLSLSGAAQELSVTPAAVSQQVRLLENRLGVPLFVRHARGLRLTRAGEALVPACRESFARLDSALQELFGRAGRDQLVVRVPLGFARNWLLERLSGFSARHPEVRIRVLVTVWASEPLDSSVDVDIRIAAAPVRGAQSHQLTADEIFPVCSPRLLTHAARLRQPADLRAHALLATIGFAEGWSHWFAAAKVPYPEQAVRVEFDSMRLALEMAALGRGVALARTSYVQDLLRSRRLRRLFHVPLTATDNLYLVLPRAAEAGSPAARFRDWIVDAP